MFDVLLNHLPGPLGEQYKADIEAVSRLLTRGYITLPNAEAARDQIGKRVEAALLNKNINTELYHVDQAI
ncbi:MAG: hypothetical protein ACSLFH_01715 [Desulfuromonadales bacterium]